MRIKKRIILCISPIVLCAMVLIALNSCKSKPTNKPIITVSIQPQKWILDKIVKGNFDVICLLSQGSNPETYEPSMNHLMNLERSKAYFRIGYIGFELAIVDKAKKNNPSLMIFDNSKDVDVMSGTHEGIAHHEQDGVHHHEIDPHIWTSVRNAKIIAKNMCDAVCEIDPSNSKIYKSNLQNLMAEFDALDEQIANKIRKTTTKAFLVWHPSLSYFARDYGLKQISMEYEGKEIPAKLLKTEIDAARESKAKVFFFQKEFDSRQVEILNEQIGAKLVTINPMNYDWDIELKHIADEFVAAENN